MVQKVEDYSVFIVSMALSKYLHEIRHFKTKIMLPPYTALDGSCYLIVRKNLQLKCSEGTFSCIQRSPIISFSEIFSGERILV